MAKMNNHITKKTMGCDYLYWIYCYNNLQTFSPKTMHHTIRCGLKTDSVKRVTVRSHKKIKAMRLFLNCRNTLKFKRQFGSNAVKAPVKFQSQNSNNQSSSLEISWDLTIWHFIRYWNIPYVINIFYIMMKWITWEPSINHYVVWHLSKYSIIGVCAVIACHLQIPGH